MDSINSSKASGTGCREALVYWATDLPGTSLALSVGMHTLLILGTLAGIAYAIIRTIKGEAMATREEFSAALDTVNTVLDTVRTETAALVAQVQELQDDLANQDIPDELMAKLQSVVDKANEIDGLVPAAPVTPEQPTPANPTPEVLPPSET